MGTSNFALRGAFIDEYASHMGTSRAHLVSYGEAMLSQQAIRTVAQIIEATGDVNWWN